MTMKHESDLPKPVPILIGNTRVDPIRVRVRGLSNFLNRGRDRGWGCHYPSHTHSCTRPDDEIIKILLVIC